MALSRYWRVAGMVLSGAALAGLLVGMLLYLGFGYASFLMILVVAAAYGWMLFAYWHYRDCRQEELLQVLAAAAEAEAPLAPALWAYLNDRPGHGLREAWVFLLLFFVLPGYYWLWYSGSSFDRKVEHLAGLLEDGYSLHEALELTPGVATRSTRLAVSLGEETGQLALCLRAFRTPARNQLATLWLELVPRLAYPLCLLLVMSGITTFWMIYIAPKMQKIFRDFRLDLPQETWWAMKLGDFAANWAWVIALAVPALLGLLIVVLFSRSIRWYVPIVGHLYRTYVSSQILQALAFLLQAGEPAPEALGLLAENNIFVGGARDRLETIRERVEQGEPLADSLRKGRVLSGAMVPLLRTAERVGNLPWALGELADLMAQRAARRAYRFGLVFFPVPIIAVGVLVGALVIGLFMPLIAIIEGLSQ